MSFFTLVQAREAVARHGTVFFDGDLNPVTPEPGDWFCEFEVDYAPDREVRDGDLVRYEGKGERSTLDGDTWVTVMRDMVWPEGADECREPGGLVLIRQS